MDRRCTSEARNCNRGLKLLDAVVYAEGDFTLELVLNLGWLALSIAVFAFFGVRFISSNTDRNRVIAALALVCVVCLLFPVISMTDDLNASPAIPEATKLKKLLPSNQFVIHLFPYVMIFSPPERVWASLALEQEQQPPEQALLCFDLSRRPPPPVRGI